LFNEFNKGYGYVDSNTPEIGIAVAEEVRGTGVFCGEELIFALHGWLTGLKS